MEIIKTIDLKQSIKPAITGTVRGMFWFPVAKAKVILEGVSVTALNTLFVLGGTVSLLLITCLPGPIL